MRNRKSRYIHLAWALPVMFLLVTGFPANAKHRSFQFEVTITNITKGQILSPAVVVSHNPSLEPIFTLGQPASEELAAVAEDAMLDPLISALEANSHVIDVGTIFGVNGPILPGESTTIVLDAGRNFRNNQVSLVGMLVTTNDAFFGLNAASALQLPFNSSELEETYLVPAYDAGSEFNSESCTYIPGPPCGVHEHDFSEAEGFVHIHPGIHGQGDLDPAEFDWRNPVAKITIRVLR